MDNLFIILVEPIYGGNVGSIARIMNNFECGNLRIVGSVPEKNDYYLAVHSEEILDNVKTFNTLTDAIADLDRIVAFSRRVGKNKPVDMSPRATAGYISSIKHLKTGLVFGRETYGLTDEEADLCPLRCHINANPKFPSLNLAQAVTVALWELYSYDRESFQQRKDLPEAMPLKEIEPIRQYMLDVMHTTGFFQDHETTNWEVFLSKMLHQLNPSKTMLYRFRQMFNRFHVLVTGKGKGYTGMDFQASMELPDNEDST